MQRASWKEIFEDPEVWKKLAIGTGCLMFMLPTPFALGIVNSDLEAEAQRRQAKEPPPKNRWLPAVDDLAKLLSSGIGPCLVYLSVMFMFAIATIPVGLSYFQLFTYFRPKNELVPEMQAEVSISIMSVLIFIIIGAVGLMIQSVIAASFPVALAQYARGKDLRPALAPLTNAITVVEMGMEYWLKSAGVAVGMLTITFYFISGGFGMGAFLSTVIWALVNAVFFISLVLASRMALDHVAAELAPSPIGAIEDQV
jgi:hypothetical protein